MDWLEVSLTVNGELAEAVAEVLSRYCPNGVTTEQGVQHLNDGDLGTPGGPITVRGYLPGDDMLNDRRMQVEEALHYLGMIQPIPEPSYTAIENQNWMEAWRKNYRPIPIGRRLMILPAWLDLPDPHRIPIRIDPGMAFGTGTHPSTQLCLGFLDELLEPVHAHAEGDSKRRYSTLIDVGCGSGILSIAAVKLGITLALGVDIDPDSIKNARENASANGIGAELVLEVGSIDEILNGNFAIRSASWVMVNILAPVIQRLLGEGLPLILEPGGRMILAGILETQADELIEASNRAGLVLKSRRQMGEWVALAVARAES